MNLDEMVEHLRAELDDHRNEIESLRKERAGINERIKDLLGETKQLTRMLHASETKGRRRV